VVIPFTAFFPAGKADPTLVQRLTHTRVLQGLLRASVGGLQTVLRRGAFSLPPSVIVATERFKKEADPLRGFIEERIEERHLNNAPFVPRMEFYSAYTTWATVNGFHLMSAQRFYESFTAALEIPIVVLTKDGTKGYKGIVLN
jgi:phage/plasmid-associated DNA primase